MKRLSLILICSPMILPAQPPARQQYTQVQDMSKVPWIPRSSAADLSGSCTDEGEMRFSISSGYWYRCTLGAWRRQAASVGLRIGSEYTAFDPGTRFNDLFTLRLITASTGAKSMPGYGNITGFSNYHTNWHGNNYQDVRSGKITMFGSDQLLTYYGAGQHMGSGTTMVCRGSGDCFLTSDAFTCGNGAQMPGDENCRAWRLEFYPYTKGQSVTLRANAQTSTCTAGLLLGASTTVNTTSTGNTVAYVAGNPITAYSATRIDNPFRPGDTVKIGPPGGTYTAYTIATISDGSLTLTTNPGAHSAYEMLSDVIPLADRAHLGWKEQLARVDTSTGCYSGKTPQYAEFTAQNSPKLAVNFAAPVSSNEAAYTAPEKILSAPDSTHVTAKFEALHGMGDAIGRPVYLVEPGGTYSLVGLGERVYVVNLDSAVTLAGHVRQHQATRPNAKLTVSGGAVTGCSLDSGGDGYTSAPVVPVTGDGRGATISLTLNSVNGTLSGCTVTSGGLGYSSASASIPYPDTTTLEADADVFTSSMITGATAAFPGGICLSTWKDSAGRGCMWMPLAKIGDARHAFVGDNVRTMPQTWTTAQVAAGAFTERIEITANTDYPSRVILQPNPFSWLKGHQVYQGTQPHSGANLSNYLLYNDHPMVGMAGYVYHNMGHEAIGPLFYFADDIGGVTPAYRNLLYMSSNYVGCLLCAPGESKSSPTQANWEAIDHPYVWGRVTTSDHKWIGWSNGYNWSLDPLKMAVGMDVTTGKWLVNNGAANVFAIGQNGMPHTMSASATDHAGQLTLSSGTVTRRFIGTYTSAPICTASDTTAANAVRVQTTISTLTITGTGNDVVNYICVARD